MMGRLSSINGGEIVDNYQNAPIMAQARQAQSAQFNDAMMARAIQKGQESPQAWDAAMKEAADAGVADAAPLVGQWNPLKAADMLRQIQGRTQTQQAISGGGGGRRSSIAEAPANPTGMQGSGPGGQYNFDAVPKEKLQSVYEGMGMALDMMRKPGFTYKDFNAGIDFLIANGHPEAEKMRGSVNELNFGEAIGPLAQRIQSTREQIAQRLNPESMGLPAQDPQPSYKGIMSEAGPVVEKTPVGGGMPSYDFAPVGGSANAAFLPPPKAAGTATTQALQDAYDALPPDQQKYIDREAKKYGVTQDMPKLGMGGAAVMTKQLIMFRNSQQQESAGRSAEEELVSKGQYRGYLAAASKNAVTGANLTMAANALEQSTTILLPAFKAVNNLPFLSLNSVLNTANEEFGDTRMVDLKNKLRATISDYTTLLVRNGVRTDAADKEASDLLSTSHTWQQAQKAISSMMQESHTLKTAKNITTLDIINAYRQSVGLPAHEIPKMSTTEVTNPFGPSAPDADTTPVTTKKNAPAWAQ